MALDKTLDVLPTLTCHELKDIKNNSEQQLLMQAVKSSIMSKQYGQEQFITDLVINACSEYFILQMYLKVFIYIYF